MMKYQKLCALAVATLTATTLACSQSAAPPTSPTGNNPGGADAGPDGSTLKVTAPVAVEPINGDLITDLDPDLVITNGGGRFVQNLELAYVFEVTDDENRVVYRSAPVAPGSDGTTRHEIDDDLESDETYTWRAYAVYQGHRGPMSAVTSFRTFNRFGVACRGTEVEIVACRKAQYGRIRHDELHEFLEKVAYDLNQMGHEHRPYGRLVKDTGNNCHGYSCDIICSNANGQQRQWDVLLDEDILQAPVWNRVPEIAVRPCEPVL